MPRLFLNAILLSCSTANVDHTLMESRVPKGTLLVVTASMAFAVLLAEKVTFGVFDMACPTFAVNMIRQIMAGHYPAEFPGSLGVAANYHQGTLLVVAKTANLLSLDPLQALRWVVLTIGAAVFALCLASNLKRGQTVLSLLLIVAVYFSASLPTSYTWPLQSERLHWHRYLSLFEYNTSGSWPLALLVLASFFLLSPLASTPKRFAASLLPGLLLLPSINATAFAVSWLTMGVMLCWVASEGLSRWPQHSWIAVGLAWCATFALPRYYTSALTVAPTYEPVTLALRLLTDDAVITLKDYAKLQPLMNYFTFVPALLQLRSTDRGAHFSSAFFLVSFAFPCAFAFTNIDRWDNLHKFVLLSSFASFFVWSSLLHAKLDRTSGIAVAAAALLSLTASIPAQYNHFADRMHYGWPSFKLAAHPDQPLFDFINQQTSTGKVLIWPYETANYCGRLGEVLKYTGAHGAGAYYDNFLLSPEIEARIAQERNWFRHDAINLQNRYPDYNHLYIVPSQFWDEFATRFSSDAIFVQFEKNFGYYSVARLVARGVPSASAR